MSIDIEFIQLFDPENLGLDTSFILISLFFDGLYGEIGFQAMAALICIFQNIPEVLLLLNLILIILN